MSVILSIVYGVIALVAYGFQDYWGPLASRRIGAFEATLLLRVFAMVFFLVAFLAIPEQLPQFTLYILSVLIMAGAFMMLGGVSYYKGAKSGNISILAPLANSFSVITMFFSFLFLNASLTEVELMGVMLVIVGTILTSFSLKKLVVGKFLRMVKGVGYGILGMVGWGIGFFLMILLVRWSGWFIAALALNAVIVIMQLLGFKLSNLKYVNPRPVLLLIVLSALVGIVGIFGYNNGVLLGNPMIVAPIAAASPAITSLLALIRQKERLESNQAVGIMIIMLGLLSLSL
jgi:uncharacterized membrane protein